MVARSRRRSGVWWGMPVRSPSTRRRPLAAPMPRKPSGWQTIARASKRSIWPVSLMPRQRLQPMKAGVPAGAGADRTAGARMSCAIASRRLPPPARAAGTAAERRGTSRNHRLSPQRRSRAPGTGGSGQRVDRPGHHYSGRGLLCRADCARLSGAASPGGAGGPVDQKPGGHRPGVAGAAGADCGLGAADRRWPPGVYAAPAAGAVTSAEPAAPAAGE
jgi:hypothetical protein